MAKILITKIDTDRTVVARTGNPQIRATNINRVFAVAETCEDENATGTIEVNLNPDEQELFNELTKRIASRISIEVKK